MIYECVDNCKRPDISDILIIKKSGSDLNVEDTIQNCCPFHDYVDGHRIPADIIDLSHYQDISYTGEEFKVIKDVHDKIRYAFACMYNDPLVESTVKEIFPHIKDIKIVADRRIRNYYLQDWMKTYNFTLKDFIMNDKYVVLSCTGMEPIEFEELNDNGLLDWDNIEHCSYYYEEEEDETN